MIRSTAVIIQLKLNQEELEQLLSVSLAVITQTNPQLNYDIASCKKMAKQVALTARRKQANANQGLFISILWPKFNSQ